MRPIADVPAQVASKAVEPVTTASAAAKPSKSLRLPDAGAVIPASITAAASSMGGKPAAAPGATIRQFVNAIDTGKLDMTMPLRSGTAYIPVSAREPLQIYIPRGAQASVSARIAPGNDGPVLSSARITFQPGFEVQNPSAIVDSLLVRFGQNFITIVVNCISIDRYGNASLDATLAGFAPPLPRIDTRLASLLSGRLPALPGTSTADPQKLFVSLGALVDKAQFEAELQTKPATIGTNTDGAQILDSKARLTVRASGSVARDNEGFAGNVKASITGQLAGTVDLGAGGIAMIKAVASALSAVVGDAISIDGQISADASANVRAALSESGDVNLTASDVETHASLGGVKLSSTNLNVVLSADSSASAHAAQVSLGRDGVSVGEHDGTLDVKVDSGSLRLGSVDLTLAPGGSVSAKLDNEKVDVRYDVQTAAKIGEFAVKPTLRGDIAITKEA